MSLQVLPLQFLNLGGEMLYIINQRLFAQTIPEDRADKVRNDIISTMFNKKFVEEMFKPQPGYSCDALKAVFRKLAHASIMRLNAVSMDKLFDLMVMALKHQMLMCCTANEILFVTLNHLDSIRSFATMSLPKSNLEFVMNLFLKTYSNLSEGELSEIRYSLLNFVQDYDVRVSLFLKEKIQNPDGTFHFNPDMQVPEGIDLPGSIRFFGSNGEINKTIQFPPGAEYHSSDEIHSFDVDGHRGTRLGINMYAEKDTPEGQTQEGEPQKTANSSDENIPAAIHHSSNKGDTKDELNLLVQLIGPTTPHDKEFKLHLFIDDDFSCVDKDSSPDGSTKYGSISVLDDEERHMHKEQLGKIFKEFVADETVPVNDDPEDLLALLDSA